MIYILVDWDVHGAPSEKHSKIPILNEVVLIVRSPVPPMPHRRHHMRCHHRHRHRCRGPIFAPIPTPPANHLLHAAFLISIPPSGGVSTRVLEGAPVAVFVGHPGFNGDGQLPLVQHSYSHTKKGASKRLMAQKTTGTIRTKHNFCAGQFFWGGSFLVLAPFSAD